MNTIKKLVQKLECLTNKEQEIELLQEINQLILHEYMIEIQEDLILYPIEVEAYYHHESHFPDTCVHNYKWQQNRFGKLYFHRAGGKEDAAFLFTRGGIDVCLSYSQDFYFGILIRAAWINNEEKPICTPGVLTREVVRHLCKDNTITKIAQRESDIIRATEEKNTVLKLAINDRRDKNSIVFNSTRFGIDPKIHVEYAQYKLRTLIELKAPNHPYKAKEKVVLDYMIDNKIEATAENIRALLGSNSNYILRELEANI